MSIIFDSIKTRNLDQVYEINLQQYFHHLVSDNLENSEVIDGEHSINIASGLQRPEFNAVVQPDIRDNLGEVMPDIKSFFETKSLPFTWYIIPSNDINDIQSKLEENGLRYIGDDIVVGVELESMVRNISSPNSLYIEAINSHDKLETWIDLYTKARNIRDTTAENYKKIFKDINLKDPELPFRKYIGWLNGEPVTCSTRVDAGGISVIYDETTLPRYRDFGIQEAINITPLKKAREAGFKLGLIPSSVGDLKRYTALKFEELFRVKKMVAIGRRRRGRRRRRRR